MKDLQHGGVTLRQWLAEKRNVIMLVASLTATMTFQAAINPPGGVWQDDSTENFQGSPVPYPHKAGDAVMPYNHLSAYTAFYIANSLSFVMFLYTIIMLITGLVFRNNYFSRFLNAIMIVFMCMTSTSVLVVAIVSLNAITPKQYKKYISRQTGKMLILISCFLVIAVIAVLARILLVIRRRQRRRSSSDDVNHANGDQEAP
ncbi:uncharacterized protein LOC132273183 [Cornus florida]|uniref:uncharacterized protein LOC132273183 n=1 Tax=Cornus florida TaxID=4283 RepID=UPI0028A10EAB|nr:uncharacterized protein LOC132273183 [Cornus florida]